MTEILKGAPVAEVLNETMQAQVAQLAAKGTVPTLAIVRVGEKPDDISYERGATKRCEKVGAAVRHAALPQDVPQQKLVEQLQALNADAGVHGILLFRPLPKGFDDELVRNTIAPEKDVDGITDGSLAGVFTGSGTGYAPCTAQACIEVLDHYGIDPKGKRAVVVGRSLTVGKPLAMMLLARHATVTVCHTRTVDMPAVCRGAELLFVSAGVAGMVDRAYLAPGQTVIDVGINVDAEGKLCGDVNYADAQATVATVTPVPGGIGTVTTSVLVKHVVQAALRAAE